MPKTPLDSALKNPAPVKKNQGVPRGVHRVRSRIGAGQLREYHYAGRGGPRFWIGAGAWTPEYMAALEKALAPGRPGQRYRILFGDYVESLVVAAQKRATSRGMRFEITAEQVIDMIAAQKGKCAVSGIKFDLRQEAGAKWLPRAPSMDRLDCSDGYVPENIQVVLLAVNVGIGPWGSAFFRRLCAAVMSNDPTP